MRNISVLNRKGGVGKTTTACSLAWLLAKLGKKVLLADLDGQQNSAAMLGQKEEPGEGMSDGISGELLGGKPSCLYRAREEYREELGNHLFVLPGGAMLEELDQSLRGPRHIKTMLDGRNGFEWCIMDCPPQINMVVLNAVYASDLVIIPTTSAASSLDGAETVLRELDEAAGMIGERPVLLLPVMFSARNAAEQEREQAIRRMKALCGDYPNYKVSEQPIWYTEKAREAEAKRVPLCRYSPCCGASMAYEKVVLRLLLGGFVKWEE